MVGRLREVRDATWFQNAITATIVAAGVLVGAETYHGFAEAWHGLLRVLDVVVLAIFVAEIVVKMGAEGSRPWRYFLDPWNVFDFTIVVVCFLPFGGNTAAILRLARLLRVLKLVRALPRLQVLVGALLKSIPSMGYISLLLFLLFYVYGVAGTVFFGPNDPVHFGRLETSMLSLFRTATLEGWTELMYLQMRGCAEFGYEGMEELCTQPTPQPMLGVAYFVSFVLIGTMVILNLFVGVIMDGMGEARAELEAEARLLSRHARTLETELDELQEHVGQLQERLSRIHVLTRRRD